VPPGFPRCIAGVTSGLTFGVLGGFSRDPLGEFIIAGFPLGSEAGLTSGSLGDLRCDQGSGLRAVPESLNLR
jgi:hypothetical protein